MAEPAEKFKVSSEDPEKVHTFYFLYPPNMLLRRVRISPEPLGKEMHTDCAVRLIAVDSKDTSTTTFCKFKEKDGKADKKKEEKEEKDDNSLTDVRVCLGVCMCV
jgi:hypothetical protein